MQPRRFGTVRPRVQIPGPRPFRYSKSAIFESLGSHLHQPYHNFPKEQPNRGAVNGFVVGNVRSPDSNRWRAGGRTGQDREAFSRPFRYLLKPDTVQRSFMPELAAMRFNDAIVRSLTGVAPGATHERRCRTSRPPTPRA